MNVKTWSFMAIAGLVLLVLVGGPASATYYEYRIYSVTNAADNSTLWVRAPENQSKLQVNSTITISIFPDRVPLSFAMAWGQQKVLDRNAFQDVTFIVKNTDNSIYFSSEVRVIFTLSYLIVDETALPDNPDWQEYVKHQQEEQQRRIDEANAKPTSWVFSAPLVAVATLFLTLGAAILAFAWTYVSKLVEYTNGGNLIWLGVNAFFFVTSMIWFAFTFGSTNREMLSAFAWLFVKLVWNAGLLAGWSSGFIGARYALKPHHFYVVRQAEKVIKEYVTVLYEDLEGKKCFAKQRFVAAFQRLLFNIHYRLVKLHDMGDVRENWTFDGESDEHKMQFINSLEIDEVLKAVKIDSTAEIVHYVWIPAEKKMKKITPPQEDPVPKVATDATEPAPQPTQVNEDQKAKGGRLKVTRRDFSNLNHVLNCNSQIKTDAQWILHCNAMEELRAEYFKEYEDNVKMAQVILIGRNKEMKQHRKDLDVIMLDLKKAVPETSQPQAAVAAGGAQPGTGETVEQPAAAEKSEIQPATVMN